MRKSVILTTAALIMMLVGGSQPARADAKSEFQKGCESGHGSFVETVDVVRCNTSSGTVIECDKNITGCTASAQVIQVKHISPTTRALQMYFTGKTRIAAPHGWKVVKKQSAD